MTSAVDIIAPKPAARPEPAKDTSRDDDRASFADALDTETSKPEATKETSSREPVAKDATAKDEPSTPDTNAAAQPVQPQQQQPTPAVNSAQAILAGLTQSAPTDAPTTEAGAEVPAIDAAAAAAATAGVAQAAGKAATPQPDANDAEATTAETAGQAIAPLAKPAQKAAAPATPAAPQQASTEDAALPATGEQQMSATVETANASTTKSAATTNTAVDPAANKAQGVQAKTVQIAANATAEAAPDAKIDTAAPGATTTVDALAATRTSATETARATATHPAMQNAPATTVQVYQRMIERFDGKAQRYEIRLDPAELGRVDVRIEVGADKKVHAVLAAHDSAALTDLMRGQRSLERALNDAGLDLADGGLRFELSGDQGRNPANQFNGNDGNGRSSNVWRGFNTLDVAVDAQTAVAARPWRSSSRLDVVA